MYILNDGKVLYCYWRIITTPSHLELDKCCYYYMYSDIVIDQYYVSDLPSVSLVTQELIAVCEKWQSIGEELGVQQDSLRSIRNMYSHPGDYLWMVLSHGAPTWKDIVAILRTLHIGEFHLADHLEAKYCSSKLTHSSVIAKCLVTYCT